LEGVRVKLFLKLAGVLLVLFILTAGSGMFYISRGLEAGAALEIGSVNPEALRDGVYKGTYEGGRWTNQVEVTVVNHRITGIRITKDVLFPKPELTEELLGRVIEKQRTDVDAVSGMTVTCKAYLKSIENALK
jgi:uncharacterized protein with FMN-binding domain